LSTPLIFKKEPAAGSGKNVFLDNPRKMVPFLSGLSILHCPQNPSDHFWFSFLIIQHNVKQLVEIKKGFRE